MVANALGLFFAIGVGAWIFHARVPSQTENRDLILPKMGRYFWGSLSILGSFAVLINADILLAQRYLPEEAWLLARAGMIARSIVYLPLPIAFAMFLKVTTRGEATRADWWVLAKAAGVMIVLLVIVLWVYTRFSGTLIYLLYGEASPSVEQVKLVRMFAWAMSP